MAGSCPFFFLRPSHKTSHTKGGKKEDNTCRYTVQYTLVAPCIFPNQAKMGGLFLGLGSGRNNPPKRGEAFHDASTVKRQPAQRHGTVNFLKPRGTDSDAHTVHTSNGPDNTSHRRGSRRKGYKNGSRPPSYRPRHARIPKKRRHGSENPPAKLPSTTTPACHHYCCGDGERRQKARQRRQQQQHQQRTSDDNISNRNKTYPGGAMLALSRLTHSSW